MNALTPGALTASAPFMTPRPAAPASDQDLILACERYLAAIRRYNALGDCDKAEDARLGAAVDAAGAEIEACPPATIAGIVAKARIAADQASSSGNDPWALAVVDDLLRLFGRDEPGPAPGQVADLNLLALLAETRAAEQALTDLYLAAHPKDPSVRKQEAAHRRASRAVKAMSGIRSVSLVGVAAKTARLCDTMRRGGLDGEWSDAVDTIDVPLAISVAADIERLLPEARA